MPNQTISVGDFSSGMVSDVIGVSNSMMEIVDGWIPRIGEIRKRGGKLLSQALDGSFEDSYRAGEKNSSLIAFDFDIGDTYGFAFVGSGNWAVKRFGEAYTPLSDTTGVSEFLTSVGGGDQITGYGNLLVSTGAPNVNGHRSVGKWAGALINESGTETAVVLTNSSGVVTRFGGATFVQSFHTGQFISVGKASATVPDVDTKFVITEVQDDFLRIDRPWSGDTDDDYTLSGLNQLAALGDPHKVGANSARVVETHQDRLFLANFDRSVSAGPTDTEINQYPSRVRWSAIWAESGDDATQGNFKNKTFYGEDLYYPDAFVDVFPGNGGPITGMHSIGNSLLILKDDAVYLLRGSVTTKGFPSGATIDVINTDVGTGSYRGSAKTEIGIAWANARGLWVYSGGKTVNLVDSVVEDAWTNILGSDFSDVVVSGVNERIIVQTPGTNKAFIYHTDKKYFSTQTCHTHTNIIPFGDSINGNVELGIDDDTGNVIDWRGDLLEGGNDSEDASFPRLRVHTQPMPADAQAFFTGRPNILLVAGQFSSEMVASIRFGRTGAYDFIQELDDQLAPDATTPLEYGIIGADVTKDLTTRIPIGGVASRGAHQFKLEEVNSTGGAMRIYGIGVEYLDDFTVNNDAG